MFMAMYEVGVVPVCRFEIWMHAPEMLLGYKSGIRVNGNIVWNPVAEIHN
jgi:hypothetical protein